jgi:hypothetical protein
LLIASVSKPLLDVSPKSGAPSDRRIMVSAKASYAGTKLDEHHAPETNGRMSVCRRCETVTDGPVGQHHIPDERQLARSNEWLVAQSRSNYVHPNT